MASKYKNQDGINVLSLSTQVLSDDTGAKLHGVHNREITQLLNAYATGTRLLVSQNRRHYRYPTHIDHEREKMELAIKSLMQICIND